MYQQAVSDFIECLREVQYRQAVSLFPFISRFVILLINF